MLSLRTGSCSTEQQPFKVPDQTAPKVETIDGEWELVNTVDALSESIGAYTLYALNFDDCLNSKTLKWIVTRKTIRQTNRLRFITLITW